MLPMAALSSRTLVDDETAKLALREFFSAVYEQDGPSELVRMFDSFYVQCHGLYPPSPRDWSDQTPDGGLHAKPGVAAKSATNGL